MSITINMKNRKMTKAEAMNHLRNTPCGIRPPMNSANTDTDGYRLIRYRRALRLMIWRNTPAHTATSTKRSTING